MIWVAQSMEVTFRLSLSDVCVTLTFTRTAVHVPPALIIRSDKKFVLNRHEPGGKAAAKGQNVQGLIVAPGSLEFQLKEGNYRIYFCATIT